jgi:hypothetical protein
MAIKNKEKYKGSYIKQVIGIIDVFDSFFEREKFKNIVEIGTGNGVFSTYFAAKAKDINSSFTTFDIRSVSPKMKQELINLDAEIIICDINKNSYIEDIICREGRCLILNDGGLKVPQFFRFSKLIKKDDIILTHDYYKNEKPAGGVIVPEDVEEYIKNNNVEIINEKMFDAFLWLCVIKR